MAISVDYNAAIGTHILAAVYEYGVCVCSCSFEVTDPDGGYFGGGFGTGNRASLIENVKQFRNVEYYSTKYFIPSDDIYLGDMTLIPVFARIPNGFEYEL